MEQSTTPPLDHSQLKEAILLVDPTTMDYPLKIAEVRRQINKSYDSETITLREWRGLLTFMAEFRASCGGW